MKRKTYAVYPLVCLGALLALAGCGLFGGAIKTITPEPGASTAASLSKADLAALEKIRESAARESGGSASPDYRVGGNDVLNITVYDEKDLHSPALRVSPDGYISFPLIGRFKVAGLTTAQIEELITHKLTQGYLFDPHVSVQVKEYNSRFYIIGEVKKPGAYQLRGNDISLVEGIGIAGGFTNFAARNSTKIIRNQNGQETVIKVKVEDITQAGTQAREIILQPNDVIIVPQSFF